MTTTPLRAVEHTAVLEAPPHRGYRLVADVTRWPLLFPPCLAAQVLDSDRDSERIRLWATVGDEVRTWTSLRKFDEEALRIDFRQEEPPPPVEWMAGRWEFRPLPAGESGAERPRTRLVLGHEWSTAAGPAHPDLVAAALDANSAREIAAVKSWSESGHDPEELVFSFTDSVAVAGSGERAYDFLHRCDLWPARLPHVDGLDLDTAAGTPAGGQVQRMAMRTRAADGSVHATRSVRLCFPGERIVYKQTTLPAGLLGHCGEWTVSALPDGVRIASRHDVALDPAALAEAFGPGVGAAEARTLARAALSANSRTMLEHAARYAEDVR